MSAEEKSAATDGAPAAAPDSAEAVESPSRLRVPEGIKLPDGTRWDGHHVELERFAGPLDLLLFLVKERQIPIVEIPVASITDQFLAHLKDLQLDWEKGGTELLDNAGDFLVMAAALIQLKARELLPAEAGADAEDEELTREELIRLLQEYERFKAAAAALHGKMKERSRIFLRTRPAVEPEQEQILKVDLGRLLDAFRQVLKRAPEKEVREMAREPIRIEERIAAIRVLLERDGTVLFSELFDPEKERNWLIATFLAILEMMRAVEVVVVQRDILGEIRIARPGVIS